jgi:four helix bundle protein
LIVSNIVEGSARGGNDFARFLRIALGSGFELETQLKLSKDLHLLSAEIVDPLIESLIRVQRQLGSPIRSIGSPSGKPGEQRTMNQ